MFRILVLTAFLSASLHADCAKDKDFRSMKDAGILVTDLTITGTHTLSSATIARISSALTGDCLHDSSDELQERVRLLFQQRGFFNAQVESLKIETRDPLALPKLVRLEAEVAEGTLCRLARIGFFGNHAFSSVSLRKELPIKKGDVFETDRIAVST